MEVYSSSGSIDKPLRVVLIVVIMTMVMPTMDTVPVPERHRTRHTRRTPCGEANYSLTIAKPIYNLSDTKKTLSYNVYKFLDGLRRLNKFPASRLITPRKAPKWVPRINIAELESDGMRRKAKFHHLLPKFYKHLLKYRIIFEKMLTMSIDYKSDKDPNERVQVIRSLRQGVRSLLCELFLTMKNARVRVLRLTEEEKSMAGFKSDVDETTVEIQDNIVLKAYNKMLRIWETIFYCGPKSKCHKKYKTIFSRNMRRFS